MSSIIDIEAPRAEQPASRIDVDIPGKLAATIGSGRHAQASLAYYAIVYSFLSGIIASILAYFLIFIFDPKAGFVDQLKTIWGIFLPIITLALGYVFGRKE